MGPSVVYMAEEKINGKGRTKMKKKFLSLAMAVLLLFAANVPAFAATADKNKTGSGIHVMFTNTSSIYADLNFTGDRADCGGYVIGQPGTTKITATAYLKRVNSNGTTTVKAWTGLTAYGEELDISKSYYVASGYDYIFEIDARVYRNGTVEYVENSSTNHCG